MSEYVKAVNDISERCLKILEINYETPEHREHEITFLLTISALAIPFPIERLKRPSKVIRSNIASRPNPLHPFREWERFPNDATRLEDLLGRNCFESGLLGNDGQFASDWELGWVERPSEPQAEWNWSQERFLKDCKNRKGKSTSFLIHILRNALAHGSVLYTSDSNNKIEKLVFLSEDRNEGSTDAWHAVRVSKKAFHEFLKAWCLGNSICSDSAISEGSARR